MCFFIHAVTENEIDYKTLSKAYEGRLYVRDNSGLVEDRRDNIRYYDLNNGHCACEIAVSPFNRVDEVRSILKDLGSKGSLRFFVTDSEEEDINDYFRKTRSFEAYMASLETEAVTVEELLQRYPERIEIDKVYVIK